MLLIAAALHEELNIALSQHRDRRKVRIGDVEFWLAASGGGETGFLKTGIGPERSAASLNRVLEALDVSQILVIGYAGALDPRFKLGTLVAVERALAGSIDRENPAVENLRIDGAYALDRPDFFKKAAESAHLPLVFADTLTTSHVWGDPEHKKILMEKFSARIVDMETAALARVAASFNLPIRCIRVVSDLAEDSFLEPFSYDPSAGPGKRARKILKEGNPVKLLREWKRNTSIARASLRKLLAEILILIQVHDGRFDV